MHEKRGSPAAKANFIGVLEETKGDKDFICLIFLKSG